MRVTAAMLAICLASLKVVGSAENVGRISSNSEVALQDANVGMTSTSLALQQVDHAGLSTLVSEVFADSTSKALLKVIGDMMVFFIQYQGFIQFIPRSSAVLEPAAGLALAEIYKTMTLQDLSERLWKSMKDKAVQLVSDYNFIAHAVSTFLAEMDSLLDYQAEANNEEQTTGPVPAEDIESIFNIGRFNDAVGSFGKHDSLMADAELLFFNLGKTASFNTTIKHLEDDKNTVQANLDSLNINITQTKSYAAQHQAELDKVLILADSLDQHKAELSSSSVNQRKFLDGEINRLQTVLTTTRAEEQRYTYNMYGNRAYVWENDVKLAKEKILVYTQELDKRERQIRELNEHRLEFDFGREQADLAQKRRLAMEHKNATDESLAALHHQKSNVTEQLQTIIQRQTKIIEEENTVSNEHLYAVLQAKSNFARVGSATATSSSGAGDFVMAFTVFNATYHKLLRAKTLKTQKMAIKILDKSSQTTLWKLLSNTRLTSLLPTLSTQEMQQVLASSSADTDDFAAVKESQLHSAESARLLNDIESTDSGPTAVEDGSTLCTSAVCDTEV